MCSVRWYLLLLYKIVSVVANECESLRSTSATCTTYWGRSSTPPLVVLSFDGFRADYIARRPELLPQLMRMRKCGVGAPYMQPSFPTKTFPNQYAIATGLYPESHGIVNNVFFDPLLQRPFSLRRNAAERWPWYGEPIWNTVVRAGMKSATIFWPGSGAAIGAHNATYNLQFAPSISMEDRIDQIVTWLKMPEIERPNFIAAYFEEPDAVSHETGAGTAQVWTQISRVDSLLTLLTEGIRSFVGCVNLMVVSDHGMVTIDVGEKLIKAQDYLPNFGEKYDAAYGPIGYVTPMVDGVGDEEKLDVLGCQVPQMRFMPKEVLPERMHHYRSDRIAPFLAEMDLGYRFVLSGEIYSHPGQHGWDNLHPEMQATFSAVGPSFKENVLARPFQNVEVYNLMCEVLKIRPAVNNGTTGALSYMLKTPARLTPISAANITVLLSQGVTPQSVRGEYLSNFPFCQALDDARFATAYEIFTKAAQSDVTRINEPWGRPRVQNSACSKSLALVSTSQYSSIVNKETGGVLLTSFVVRGMVSPQQVIVNDFPGDVWYPNFQLPKLDNGKKICEGWVSEFDSTTYKLYPNFPFEFAVGDEPWLITNSMLLPRDNYIGNALNLLFTSIGSIATPERPVYVVGGIAITAEPFICERHVPRKLGYIISQCRTAVKNMTDCPSSQLEVQAFILPTHLRASSKCINTEDFLKFHVATVRDVELASGFVFFPNLPASERVELVTRVAGTSSLVLGAFPSWFAK